MANRAGSSLLFDQLPLARSLEAWSSPAKYIQHITLRIGYYDSTPATLVRDFNHLGIEPAKPRIFIGPLLADSKSIHSNAR